MSESPRPVNPLFRLVVVAAGVFVFTVLLMGVAPLSDPQSPLAQFFDRHDGTIIAVEVGVILLAGLGALVLDRRASRREERQREVGEQGEGDDEQVRLHATPKKQQP